MEKICIFGVGLIGGSLALALKKKSPKNSPLGSAFCSRITGCSRDERHLQRAVELGVIDDYSMDPWAAASDADLIFLGTPVGATEIVLRSIKDCLSTQTIITDGGSCKASVVAAAKRALGSLPPRFVPGHPIAGREKSGVDYADANLYANHKVILTPDAGTDPDAIETVRKMWTHCGAAVETMNVEQHDRVLAATSHLPHVLAYALVESVASTTYISEIFEFAAGGFRDSSRVASSDPTMWRDICVDNREAILEMILQFQTQLKNVERLIEEQDGERLYELFEKCKRVRDERFG